MNKFYIQIALFLLSIFVYANNEALGSEPAPRKSIFKSKKCYPTSEEIYEKNKHLLCTNPEEIKNAEKLMKEAIEHLKYHATNKNGYKLIGESLDSSTFFYKKKHGDNTNVEKIQYKVQDSNKYNKIVNKYWNPDICNPIDYRSFKNIKKITRVYNPNLVIIQRRYKKGLFSHQKYFYALAKKVQLSEDKTIIVMTSANINDHHPSDKEYKNTIIENANLFTTDVDSEEDIRKGKLKKTFLNVGGYLIEKGEKCVSITYIESIDGHSTI
ncbi:Acidic phosphoprotein precursor PCEMA1, putative [Plasmodium chabaudi chabaudi]|uniref:Acidic phosphoprotein PCEMA1, putative n=1 Tax=Plasmodium chabaudi chabaudi TaxID=31271 RepID=A0A1C6WKK2_PLACU|nr:Acidic phosphoprotein precursor PCEMA1, putative [Plasmodium chabaudi chabaudi]